MGKSSHFIGQPLLSMKKQEDKRNARLLMRPLRRRYKAKVLATGVDGEHLCWVT